MQAIQIIHPYFKVGGISGYISIHLPRRVVKKFDITRKTEFLACEDGGRLNLVQQAEGSLNVFMGDTTTTP